MDPKIIPDCLRPGHDEPCSGYNELGKANVRNLAKVERLQKIEKSARALIRAMYFGNEWREQAEELRALLNPQKEPGCIMSDHIDIDDLWTLFIDHYWDSLSKDRDLILTHIDAVLRMAREQPLTPRQGTDAAE